MTERNDQWSWDGVNSPYNEAQQPGQYGAAPTPYGGGQSPYGDQPDGAPTPPQTNQPQPPVQPGQPAYGQPGQPGYGQPGQPATASYGEQLAWNGGAPNQQFAAGDLKPGIIALRPLNFGEFFDGGFRAIQHNPQVMFGLSLAVAVVLGLFEVILLGSGYTQLLTDPFATSAMDTGALLGLSGGAAVSAILSVVATIILNGVLVISVSQSILGRKVAIGEVWGQVKGVIWPLIGATFLVSLLTFTGIFVGVLAVAVIAGVMIGVGSESSFVVVIILAVLVFAAIFALAAFFYVRFGLATTAIVMERAPVIESMRRSWRLTKGFFWRNAFVLLLALIVVGAISGVFSVPISVLAGWVASTGSAGLWLAGILTIAISALISALTTPFIAAVSALLYVDLRMRKEGLDVELIRAASA